MGVAKECWEAAKNYHWILYKHSFRDIVDLLKLRCMEIFNEWIL
jgi:hypothetical protein